MTEFMPWKDPSEGVILQKTTSRQIVRIIGAVGAIAYVIFFAIRPSFPTPDKILIFLIFASMYFGQTKELLKRFLPFVTLLVIYESFRGLAHTLNTHVNFTFMAKFDIWLFGSLPTASLQHWLWHGVVRWYDFVFYFVYTLHFIMPLALAVLVWKLRDHYYWRFVSSYVALSFAGFLTYLLYPAAPPWMASEMGYIQPIVRVSSSVWYALGVHDYPSLYSKIAPNPVAAVPSLHAAYAILFVIYIFKLFGKKWGTVALLYPFLMCFGIVYEGEHYVFDVILGAIYAFLAFFLVERFFNHHYPLSKNKVHDS